MHDRSTPLDRLREATSLAHTVPGVSLRLTTSSGHQLLVSHDCLGADLTPCQLRGASIASAVDPAMERFIASVVAVDFATGITHVGGGLHERCHPGAANERWFVTTLDDRAIADVLSGCPFEDADSDSLGVLIKPDLEMGVSVVRATGDVSDNALMLDDFAAWLMGAVAVEELLAVTAAESTS